MTQYARVIIIKGKRIKIKQGKQKSSKEGGLGVRGEDAVLDREANRSLTEKVSFEQRNEDKEMSHTINGGRTSEVLCEGLNLEHFL